MEGSPAQLVVTLPAECGKELFRNPSAQLVCEILGLRVLSTSGAEHEYLLDDRISVMIRDPELGDIFQN